MTTITTVGYGDISGNTLGEYIYCMFIEFVGLSFFSFQMGSVSHMLSGTTKFEQIINEHLENLDLWLRKLELSSTQKKLPMKLYLDIKQFIKSAFVYDFNLLIEEFDFYYRLPPNI